MLANSSLNTNSLLLSPQPAKWVNVFDHVVIDMPEKRRIQEEITQNKATSFFKRSPFKRRSPKDPYQECCVERCSLEEVMEFPCY